MLSNILCNIIEINEKSCLTLDGKVVCYLNTTDPQQLKYYIRQHSDGDKELKQQLKTAAGKWYINYGMSLIS